MTTPNDDDDYGAGESMTSDVKERLTVRSLKKSEFKQRGCLLLLLLLLLLVHSLSPCRGD